jgi:nucleoside-diphosphate-sugar epimerase
MKFRRRQSTQNEYTRNNKMKVFITGATGYIGGSVAAGLAAAGHEISGLTRTKEKAEFLISRGIKPVLGELDDAEIIGASASEAEIIINAASTDHRGAVDAVLKAIVGTGKTFIHTSGSSIAADKAAGEPNEKIFDENTEIDPIPERIARRDLEKVIVSAATDNVRSIIICPSMIYGQGTGYHTSSNQIPLLIAQAKARGVGRYVGKGENRWANVNISDVVDLYLLAIEKAKPGDYFFAENGEESIKNIAEEIGRLLNFSPPAMSISYEEAVEEWGAGNTLSISSNSRVRAKRARELGWLPKIDNVIGSIKEEI